MTPKITQPVRGSARTQIWGHLVPKSRLLPTGPYDNHTNLVSTSEAILSSIASQIRWNRLLKESLRGAF